MEVGLTSPSEAAGGLHELAFKKLYPEQYFDRWLSEGIRPDGRTLGRGRAVSIGLGVVSSAHGSALVRIGQTTVLAGARAALIQPPEDTPSQGEVRLELEIVPFATGANRGGGDRARALECSSDLRLRLELALRSLNVVEQLCVKQGKAVFCIELDVYVLNQDGAVLDASLLASVSALKDLVLPSTAETKTGGMKIVQGGGDSCRQQEGGQSDGTEAAASSENKKGRGSSRLHLHSLPLATTCCLHKSHLLMDPTAEEESHATSHVSVVVDQEGILHGVYKSGDLSSATPGLLLSCIEAAKLRHQQVSSLLQEALMKKERDLSS